mgnify:CR=1 FL=1
MFYYASLPLSPDEGNEPVLFVRVQAGLPHQVLVRHGGEQRDLGPRQVRRLSVQQPRAQRSNAQVSWKVTCTLDCNRKKYYM